MAGRGATVNTFVSENYRKFMKIIRIYSTFQFRISPYTLLSHKVIWYTTHLTTPIRTVLFTQFKMLCCDRTALSHSMQYLFRKEHLPSAWPENKYDFAGIIPES